MITIPKNLTKKEDLVVIQKSEFTKLSRENHELRSALKAIALGEKALKSGKTRSLEDFLSHKHTKRAKHK